MKTRRDLFAALVAILVLPLAKAESSGVADIRALYARTNNLIERRVVVQISLDAVTTASGVSWQTKGKRGRDESNGDLRANVYVLKGRIVKARVETSSQSGDWKLSEEYYFFENGQTAFYFKSLLTFQGYDYEHDRDLPPGPYVVEERIYYGESGREIKHLERAFVQQTKQELSVKYVRANLPTEFYPNAKALPFYKSVVP